MNLFVCYNKNCLNLVDAMRDPVDRVFQSPSYRSYAAILILAVFARRVYLPHLGGRFLRILAFLNRRKLEFVDDGMILVNQFTGLLGFSIHTYSELVEPYRKSFGYTACVGVCSLVDTYRSNESYFEKSNFDTYVVASADMDYTRYSCLYARACYIPHPRVYKNIGAEGFQNRMLGLDVERYLLDGLSKGNIQKVFIGRSFTAIVLLFFCSFEGFLPRLEINLDSDSEYAERFRKLVSAIAG